MPLIVLDLVGAPSKISGMLSRRLLEVRAGLFVGSLSTRVVKDLWDVVEHSSTKSATLIFPARNELGMSLRTKGESRYKITDYDGLLLITFCLPRARGD